jgi:NADPH:quinone reductase-like Zn-dependent oxidoreductase
VAAEGGCDVILDMVGGDYFAKNMEALRPRGRMVYIAAQGGSEVTLSLTRLLTRRIVVTGSTLRSRDADEKARLAAEVERVVWPWIESGKIRPQVDRTFKLAEAAQAHVYLEGNTHFGKLILTMD